MEKRKILIVEADRSVSLLIGATLDAAGFRHVSCPCDSNAYFNLQTDHFDLILLDAPPDKPDGLELLERLGGMEIPLIFLADRAGFDSHHQALQLGAEDFILKPFAPEDLIGRIEKVLSRRRHNGRQLRYHDIEIDLVARQVSQAGQPVRLTPKEFDLLVLLVEHADAALSRARILQAVWGYCITGDTRTVDMHIMQLRKKLEFGQKLRSVIKVGYRLDR